MTETIAQHPPAMKVGGRRLSVTSRPKPHVATEPKPPSPTTERTDYPRPTAPGEQQVHDPQHQDHEEVPKKQRKQGSGGAEHERRMQESLYTKAGLNRPSKDMSSSAKNIVGGGRIGQPAGKGIAA